MELTRFVYRIHMTMMSASQQRLENTQAQLEATLSLRNRDVDSFQSRVIASSDCLEEAQIRMEIQLARILAAQQRRPSPLRDQSLDSSNPEGRETWMNLDRFLREEGITPAMISDNRDVLVKAMKTTLENEQLSSAAQSYYTANESFSASYQASHHAASSADLFGSAPQLSATFTDGFLQRHNTAHRSLNQEGNLENGLQSLLVGMEENETNEHVNAHDGIDDTLLDLLELEA